MKYPRQWLEASRSGAPDVNEIEIQARIKMDEQTVGKGKCPSCRAAMRGPVFCSDLPMQMCWPCRIAMPYEDSEHRAHKESVPPYKANPVPAFIT